MNFFVASGCCASISTVAACPDLPAGRVGKHHEIVLQLLDDLERLEDGRAIKIALTDLPDSKENVRSTLNRATRKRNLPVATSSDAEYFYIWKNLA